MNDLAPALALEVLRTLPVAVVVVEADGGFVFVNAEAEALLGPVARPGIGTRIQDVLQIDLDAQPLPRVLFSPPHAKVTLSVTAEWVTEAALPKTQRVLVLRRADELGEGAAPLIAMLGHELRNPLAPIRLAAEHLRRGQDDPTHACRTIERQVVHLARLVDDLLDAGRASRGTLQVTRASMRMLDAVDTAVEASRSLMTDHGHTLELGVDELLGVEVDGDLVRLTQVIANLLRNAAKYTPPGGSVSVRGWRDGDRAVVRVTDTGRGIESQLLDELFEPFVQGRQPLDRRLGGLGLGLPVSKQIVELHGGRLVGKSQGLGKGAAFTISLPGARVRPVVDPEAVAAATGDLRVLIIDDNLDAAQMLGLVLGARGASCEIVESGVEGLARMQAERFDVAIVDIGLPELDGYAVAQAAGRLDSRPARLVALSGYGHRSDVDKAQGAGFDAYFVKPVAQDQLEALLGLDTPS